MRAIGKALMGDKMTLVAAIVFLLIVVATIFGPLLIPLSPTQQDLLARNIPPFSANPDGGFPHILGTDQLGRDVLVRLLVGGRLSLTVGFLGVVMSGIIGTCLGVLAGFYRGALDNFLMRVVDAQLAMPFLLIALFVLFVFGRGIMNLILVLAFVRWPVYARVARSLTMQIRSQAYIDGARIVGCGNRRLIVSHVFPNLLSPMVALATLEIARLILAESTLSFLGIGVQPPGSSWGLMVAQGRDVMGSAPWNVFVPGLMIFTTTLSVTLVATWLRAVTDPAQRWRWFSRPARK